MKTRTTCNFNFYCRESKTNKQGLAPIELSVIINGKRHYMNLAMKCKPTEFNRTRRSKTIEDFLSVTRNNLNQYLVEVAEQGLPLTADSIYNLIRTGGIRIYTIEDLFNDFNKILELRIGVDMGKEQMRKYTLVQDEFFKAVDKTREASSISNADILAFKSHAYGTMAEGTAAGYMARLKAYIKYGRNNSHIPTDPFAGVKIVRKEKPVQTITKEELDRIINKDFGNDRLNHIKELFVFSCGSGLAFADVMNLKPTDFQERQGRLCIFGKERQKTSVKFYSILLPFAADIARKYNYDLSTLKISNQKTNSYLKEIQTLCNITSVESLHFHLARHYYATNAINSGIPLEIVQKMVGHSQIKQTIHYSHLMESTIIKSVIDHIN